MNKNNEIDSNFFSSVVETIMSFEKTNMLSIDDVYKIAKRAIEADQIKNMTWIENEVEEHLKRCVRENESQDQSSFLNSIKVSSPKNINNRNDLMMVVNEHKIWMDSVRSSGTTLYGHRANLVGANLSGYSLERLNLSCANFDGANLVGANLSHANLAKCSFIEANLQGAILYHTNFRGAIMNGCDLRDADIESCNFEKVDLSKVALDSKYLDLCCSGAK